MWLVLFASLHDNNVDANVITSVSHDRTHNITHNASPRMIHNMHAWTIGAKLRAQMGRQKCWVGRSSGSAEWTVAVDRLTRYQVGYIADKPDNNTLRDNSACAC